jgi:hypothetical protein
MRVSIPALLALPPLLAALDMRAHAAPPATAVTVRVEPARPAADRRGDPLLYWTETRDLPRPLRIHVLRLDLAAPGLALRTLVAADPDGVGPAEAALTDPLVLAGADSNVLAAVNANAFAQEPPPPKGERADWRAGLPVTILSWARSAGFDRSAPQQGYASFWVTAPHRADAGNVAVAATNAIEAVAGFSDLVDAGRVLPKPDETLHPRTAVGTDADGRFVWLVVVDGRQRGYSEGMSAFELVGLMRELGCTEAVNLDGGGSSAMLVRGEAGALQVMNRPSGGSLRPVPVMLAIVRTTEPAGRSAP